MNDRIDLTGLEVRARHGVLPREQEVAQLFRIDLSVYADLAPAAQSDHVGDTIDYGALASEVHDVVAGASHRLLETVADRVVRHVLTDPRVRRVVVTVHKPEAPIPIPFADVSVTVDRAR